MLQSSGNAALWFLEVCCQRIFKSFLYVYNPTQVFDIIQDVQKPRAHHTKIVLKY